MFIKVRLLKGFSEPLWYRVPADWDTHNLVGKMVSVPLRNAFKSAVVLELAHAVSAQAQHFVIKDVHARQELPEDPHYAEFLDALSSYYQVEPLVFLRRLQQFLAQKEVREKIIEEKKDAPKDIILNEEQQAVVDFLIPKLQHPSYTPVLLHGVTGSGKTEVYKKAIEHTVLQEKKTVILLLPEVTLALQFEALLKKSMKDIPIFGFHSATSPSNKRLLWQQLCEQKPVLIIGVHLPILLPIADLGLIIVDEEHESGYQEKKHPKIHSKEAALMRARLIGIPIVLGSATPSVSSLYNVEKKGWHFFQLQHRFSGAMPRIQTVLLSDERNKNRKHFWFSDQLIYAINDRLVKKEQSIIFINRRGFCFFVQCKSCSFIVTCNTCSVSLTLHETGLLHCHYCGFSVQQPRACASCKKTDFLKKGIGTQQIVSMLEKIFPSARIGRADMDMTSKKNLWQQTLDDFQCGALDILVGTQVITKGFHFPCVTLVGIIWADLNLHFPVYNAGESALQQLIQVAGRAGREREDSLVVVQTMSDHPIFAYVHELDYVAYAQKELAVRKEVGYPPCMRLAELELRNTDDVLLEAEAQVLIKKLNEFVTKNNHAITLLGPAKPPVYKIKNICARKIYLKAIDIRLIHLVVQQIQHVAYTSRIFFTPNPSS